MNTRDPQRSELRPLAHWLHAAAAELHAKVPPPLASARERKRESTGGGASKPAAARPPVRSPLRWPWQRGAWTLASLACISVLVAVFTGSQPAPRSHEFVALASAERWLRLDAQPNAEQAAGATAWLVQTEMPQERLAAFGLPFDPGRAAMPVRAELLMRASGEVLALRILD